MKVVVEIDPAAEEEVRVRAKTMTPAVRRLGETLGSLLSESAEIAVKKGEREFFLSPEDILYAETAEGRVWVHTARDLFLCPLRLRELEELLPRHFVRASKSCLLNTAHVAALSRTPTGVGEAEFRGGKKVFISRMYYKPVRDMIEETRLKR